MRFLVLLPRCALKFHKHSLSSLPSRNRLGFLELSRLSKVYSHQHRYIALSSITLQDKKDEPPSDNHEPKTEAEKKLEPTHVKGNNLLVL